MKKLKRRDRWGCWSNYPPIQSLGAEETALKVPCRSPLVIINIIKPFIEGKVVCEIGSALGDIALGMKKYAKKVIGIEIDEERAAYSKKRDLDVRCGDALEILPLPEKIDVYYMWTYPEVMRSVFNKIKEGVVIMGGELGDGKKEANYKRGIYVKLLDELHKANPDSKMFEILYNEGLAPKQSGIFVLLIVNK